MQPMWQFVIAVIPFDVNLAMTGVHPYSWFMRPWRDVINTLSILQCIYHSIILEYIYIYDILHLDIISGVSGSKLDWIVASFYCFFTHQSANRNLQMKITCSQPYSFEEKELLKENHEKVLVVHSPNPNPTWWHAIPQTPVRKSYLSCKSYL